MPRFDFGCQNCGHEFEVILPMGETRKKCPKCGKLKLKQLWNKVAAFHSRYSPMAPRAGRGAGNTGERKC